jgi:hypothetical protein
MTITGGFALHGTRRHRMSQLLATGFQRWPSSCFVLQPTAHDFELVLRATVPLVMYFALGLSTVHRWLRGEGADCGFYSQWFDGRVDEIPGLLLWAIPASHLRSLSLARYVTWLDGSPQPTAGYTKGVRLGISASDLVATIELTLDDVRRAEAELRSTPNVQVTEALMPKPFFAKAGHGGPPAPLEHREVVPPLAAHVPALCRALSDIAIPPLQRAIGAQSSGGGDALSSD